MERRKNRLKRERQKRKFPASEQAIDIIKRPFRLNRLLCILGSVIFLKMGHSWTLFLLFSSFQYNTVYNKLKFAGVWIPTEDLWYWKQLLCQLSHNHCSRGYSYILMWSLRHLPDKVDPYTRVGTIWTNWQRAIGRYLGMRWRLVSAKVVSCCVHVKPKKNCSTCTATFHTCLTSSKPIQLFVSFFRELIKSDLFGEKNSSCKFIWQGCEFPHYLKM